MNSSAELVHTSEPRPSGCSDRAALGLLGMELDRASTSSDDDSAVPVEIETELTSPYPVGLCDDLRGLSSCRQLTGQT